MHRLCAFALATLVSATVTASQPAAGARYRASIDEPVAVGSQAVISKGATCMVEAVSIGSGKEMALRLRDVNVNSKSYSLSTDYADVNAQGTSKTKKAVWRGIGAIFAAAAKGKQINLPAETRLIFSLKAPAPMN